jgi:hypothetical protein
MITCHSLNVKFRGLSYSSLHIKRLLWIKGFNAQSVFNLMGNLYIESGHKSTICPGPKLVQMAGDNIIW